jgi:serine O-acetyltransferase
MDHSKFSDMLRLLAEDYMRVGKAKGNIFWYIYKFLSNAGFRAIFLYRLGRWFKLNRMHFLAGMCQRFMHHWAHCWISVSAEIGPGFLIAHVGSIVIGGNTRIGSNCDIRQNVTLGGNFNKTLSDGRTQPYLNENISIGVGAVILGPVEIGSNSIIGANSVVTRDIPPNVIAFGVPAVVIKTRWDEKDDRRL